MLASGGGHLDIVKYLHQNGADINKQAKVRIRYVSPACPEDAKKYRRLWYAIYQVPSKLEYSYLSRQLQPGISS